MLDLAVDRIRKDVDDGAGSRLLPVAGREGRVRLMLNQRRSRRFRSRRRSGSGARRCRDDIGGLRLELPAVAAVAGLIEAQPTGDDARHDAGSHATSR